MPHKKGLRFQYTFLNDLLQLKDLEIKNHSENQSLSFHIVTCTRERETETERERERDFMSLCRIHVSFFYSTN